MEKVNNMHIQMMGFCREADNIKMKKIKSTTSEIVSMGLTEDRPRKKKEESMNLKTCQQKSIQSVTNPKKIKR